MVKFKTRIRMGKGGDLNGAREVGLGISETADLPAQSSLGFRENGMK